MSPPVLRVSRRELDLYRRYVEQGSFESPEAKVEAAKVYAIVAARARELGAHVGVPVRIEGY